MQTSTEYQSLLEYFVECSLSYAKIVQIAETTKCLDNFFLTVRLKRAEGPKALSPGHRPGYKSNQ